jgi:hypothetical protein
MLVMVLVTDFTMYLPLSFNYHSLLIIVLAAACTSELRARAAKRTEEGLADVLDGEPSVAPVPRLAG